MRILSKIIPMICLAAISVVTAQSATITIANEVNGALVPDAYIQSGNPTATTLNDAFFVGNVSVGSGIDRSLIRFDLSSYAGQTVTGNGTLTLTVRITNNSISPAFSVDLYTVNSANSGWETGWSGLPSRHAANASWNNLNQVNSTPWSGGVGLGNPGDGYGNLQGSVFGTNGAGHWTAGNTITYTIAQSVLQSWIDTPSSDAGLFLKGSSEDTIGRDIIFYNGYSANTANLRPVLTFDAISVPEPTSVALLALGCGFIALRYGRRLKKH